MPTFKKRIVISAGFQPEFLFNRVYTVSGVHYFISVMDQAHKHYNFSMEQRGSGWRVMQVATTPGWLTGSEGALEEAIVEHLAI